MKTRLHPICYQAFILGAVGQFALLLLATVLDRYLEPDEVVPMLKIPAFVVVTLCFGAGFVLWVDALGWLQRSWQERSLPQNVCLAVLLVFGYPLSGVILWRVLNGKPFSKGHTVF